MNNSKYSENELIQQFQGLVKSIAITASRHLPNTIELDDLIGYGQIGLAEAARDFDPEKKFKFSTYAYYRIRGSIFDGVATMSWHSRHQYRKARLQQMADATLSEDSDEITDNIAKLVIIRLAIEAGGDGIPSDIVSDRSAEAPEHRAEFEEARNLLVKAIETLDDEEQTLLRKIYFHGSTLTDAAKTIGKSKSWASRMHDRALKRLLNRLRHVGVEEPTR